ncbi:MAG: ATP-binding protein [Bacteroidia bacterium]
MQKLLHRGSNFIIFLLETEDEGKLILKVPTEDFPSKHILEQLENEQKILGGKSIPGLREVLGFDEKGGRKALRMRYHPGDTLKHFLDGKPLSLDRFFVIASALVEAVGNMHAEGIMHKDLNPNNIIYDADSERLVIIDFGISTFINPKKVQLDTHIEGTLGYMAPEQTGRTNHSLDYRCDMYALGVTMFEMLTGRLPFEVSDPMEAVHAHLAKKPKFSKEEKDLIPSQIRALVRRCLKKRAEDRYQSAEGLQSDLMLCQTSWEETGSVGFFELGKKDISPIFRIPTLLYGRDHEKATLVQNFEIVCGGELRVVTVSGDSGTGKSALVASMRLPVSAARGFFGQGKHEQFLPRTPFYAIGKALGEIVLALLRGPEAYVSWWKMQLEETLKEEAVALISLIPELELLIGPQEDLKPLSLLERQRHLQTSLNAFIRVLAKANHPLVLFVDDIQWSDSASRQWIEQVPEALGDVHMMLVLVYREKETANLPLVSGFLERLRQSTSVEQNLSLGPLLADDIEELVADTLRADKVEVRDLAQLITDKTHGNAFFVHQFLISLYENEHVRFDFKTKKWGWNIKAIQELDVTDNVVSFLAEKLKKLDPQIQRALMLGACLGNSFELEELQLIVDHSEEQLEGFVQSAEAEGFLLIKEGTFIEDTGEERATICKFIHDRVQQAVYSLISEEDLMHFNLSAARSLSKGLSAGRREDRIFEIANSFIAASPLVEGNDEKLVAARICQQAGKKALDTASPEMAHRYLKQGISFLPENSWKEHYETSFSLTRTAGLAAYGESDLEAVRHYATLIRAHGKDALDKSISYRMEIDIADAEQKMEVAADAAVEALQSLGVKVPRRPSQLQVGKMLIKSLWKLRGMKGDDLVKLPRMTSPRALAIVDIIASVAASAYRSSPELFAYLTIESVLTSVKHGNAPASGFGYATYGVILLAAMKNFDRGIDFGKAGMEICNQFPTRSFFPKTAVSFATPLVIWEQHMRASVELLHEAMIVGKEVGDPSFMGSAGSSFHRQQFWMGKNLPEMGEPIQHTIEACKKARQEFPTGELKGILQISRQMMGHSPASIAESPYFQDEETFLKTLKKAGDMSPIYFFYTEKMAQHFYEGRDEEVLHIFEEAQPYKQGVLGLYEWPVSLFYNAMAQLLVDDSRRLSETFIKKNIKRLAIWSERCADNFGHMHAILKGEYARYQNRQGDALASFSEAIQIGRTSGFIHMEALAWERIGMLQRAMGNDMLAETSLVQAAERYQRWGCTTRLEYLQNIITDIDWSTGGSRNTLQNTTRFSGTSNYGQLDVSTVIKAAQTLSGEVVRENLFSRMVDILAENAGAERAVLLLPYEDGDWQIAAQTESEDNRKWPMSLVTYASHTRETIMLEDASTSNDYEDDPYMIAYAPKSVLCMPILRDNQVQGIVYLENNLMVGAFDEKRLEMLRILSAQLAISFENATLYESLEARVEERTAEVVRQKDEIEAALDKLQQAQLQLLESEKMASLGQLTAGIAHEINNPVNFIMAGIRSMRRNMKEVLGIWQEYDKLDPENAAALLPKIRDKIEEDDLDETVEEVFELAESIERGAVRTAEIVRGLRLFSRLDEGEFKRVELHESLEASLLMLRSQYKNRIEVVKDFGKIPEIECLAGKLNQVFMNILSNAIQAIEGEGTISIKTHRKDADHIEIVIRDSGPGIPLDVQNRIFDPFFTTKDVGQGTGLGLSISHGIIEQHHGKIWIESASGEGTAFFIMLPVKQPRDNE